MNLPESFTTVTRTTKTVALILFIALPFIGFCLGQKYQKVQNQIEIMESIKFPAPSDLNKDAAVSDTILSHETKKCNLFVKLTSGKKILAGKLNSSGMESPKCVLKIDSTVSPSGKYLAFADITGGIDSVVRIYSLEKQNITDLYVYGTSTINDVVFLMDDVLAVMNSFPGNYDEQWLRFYDIPALYKNYDANITEYGTFTLSERHEKGLVLPNHGVNYTDFRLSTEALIAQTEDPELFEVFGPKDYRFRVTDTELVEDLMSHPELIPYDGVLGGTMGFYNSDQIKILSDKWVSAGFDDGHITGSMLLEYSVSDEGEISWTVIEANLD